LAKPPTDRPPGEAALLSQFGTNLRRTREGANLTQRALARAAGVSQTAISYIELGETAPSLLLVYRIARALDMKPTDLLKGLPSLPPRSR